MLTLNWIGCLSILKKAITGAPRLSTPKAGKDWTWNPSWKNATAKTLEATTAP
jgi:hypothetical protein